MKKYLAVFAVCFLLCIYVTNHSPAPTKSPSVDSNHSNPSWYRFFSWPEGMATWVVFLTLLAIAEQTRETAKAARASQEQVSISRKALIGQLRPKIRIRKILLLETDNSLTLQVIVVNKGASAGHVLEGTVDIAWCWGHRVEPTHQATTSYEKFTLLAGEDAPLNTNMTDGWVLYRMAVNYVDEGRPEAMTIRCSGQLSYVDENGVKRHTAFRRLLNHGTGRFMPDENPELEYHD